MSRNGAKTSLLGRLRTRHIVTVDFDSTQMRLAEVVHGPIRPRVRKLIAREIPADIDISEPQQIGQCLAEVLKEHKLHRCPVVMNIPRGQAILKPLRLPPGTAGDEVAAMVQFQVQGELPFRTEEAVLDFIVEGETPGENAAGPGGLDVLAAAVRLPVVDYYRNVAETAGARLLRVGLRPSANTRCVQVAAPGAAGTRTGVVHITADETQIDVIEDGRMVFSRSAVVKLNDAAESGDAPIDRDVKERVDMVVAEIVRSLQGYAALENATPVERVLIAGGTGLETDVADILSQVEDLNCQPFNPADQVKLSGTEQAGQFITVIGLAFEGETDCEPFDFLHPKQPAVHRDPKRERLIAAGLAAGILLFISAFGGWFLLNSRQQEVDDLLASKRRESDREEFVDRLIDRVDAVDDWVDEGIGWLDHWAKLTSLMPPADEAYIDDLRTSRDAITFVVHARESEQIDAFVRRLREAGYVPRASKDGVDASNPFGYVRQTTISLDVDPDVDVAVADLDIPPRPEDDDLARPLDDVRRRGGRR